jgi:hypothetical protein
MDVVAARIARCLEIRRDAEADGAGGVAAELIAVLPNAQGWAGTEISVIA